MEHSWKVSVTSSQGLYTRILNVDSPELLAMRQAVGTQNFETFLLLACAWTSLIGDSPLELKPFSKINRFLTSFICDPLGTIARLSEIANQLETSLLADSQNVDIDKDISPLFFGLPIFREYQSFRTSHEPVLLRYLLSFLNFGKKVVYENSNLDAIALSKWHTVEDRLGNLELPDWLCNLKKIVEFFVADWKDCTFIPKHGNGSVADRGIRGSEDKNEAFALPAKIVRCYIEPSLPERWDLDPRMLLPQGSITSNSRIRTQARLKFVPKTYKTTRSICMEPVGYQWAQQGVRDWYERELSESVLGAHVVLKNQGENQLMAMRGSRDLNIDTIDLSSASDSVAWDLVKKIFPSKVLKHLHATRSSEIELPGGTMYKAHKFAPMGSALCFPVQSTIYSAIVMMVSIAQVYGLEWKTPGCFEQLNLRSAYDFLYADGKFRSDRLKGHVPFRCYGDDITCDKRVTSSVIDCLQLLGFCVNIEKSFIANSTYRESCGKHYHRGNDVTPIRFKTKQLSPEIDGMTLGGIIDFANRALDYNYLNLRRVLIQYSLYVKIEGVKRVFGARNPILFVEHTDTETSFAIRCVRPNNKHLIKRGWSLQKRNIASIVPKLGSNLALQRAEFRSITIGAKDKRKLSRKFDNYHYTLWWRSRYQNDRSSSTHSEWMYLLKTDPMIQVGSSVEDDEELSSSSILTADVLSMNVKRRWTPA